MDYRRQISVFKNLFCVYMTAAAGFQLRRYARCLIIFWCFYEYYRICIGVAFSVKLEIIHSEILDSKEEKKLQCLL